MGTADEVAGAYPEPTALGRAVHVLAVVLLCAAGLTFPVVAMTAEVGNALRGDFRSYGTCSVVAVVCLALVGRLLWRVFVWDPPRLIRRFRYAGGVLEYQTNRHGSQMLPLGQVAGVYVRPGKGGQVFGWPIRRADGEWLVLDGVTENGQELIDRLCRDGGWGEPAQSPV